MNPNTVLVLLTGLCVRLAVPLAVTALVVLVLRRLDIRWQAEAERERNELAKAELPMPCWKETELSREEFKLQAEQSARPCWQIRRLSNGYLREACLECEVFLTAPIPAPKHSPAHP